MLICIDAGHYIGTPGKRCLKGIDPGRPGMDPEQPGGRPPGGHPGGVRLSDHAGGRRDRRAGCDPVPAGGGSQPGPGGCVSVHSPQCRDQRRLRRRHRVLCGPGHQRQSEVVRDAVYRYTVAATGLQGNQAQPLAEQSLYVLNYTTMPATLIELGFMDSTTDTPIILTERFCRRGCGRAGGGSCGGV